MPRGLLRGVPVNYNDAPVKRRKTQHHPGRDLVVRRKHRYGETSSTAPCELDRAIDAFIRQDGADGSERLDRMNRFGTARITAVEQCRRDEPPGLGVRANDIELARIAVNELGLLLEFVELLLYFATLGRRG